MGNGCQTASRFLVWRLLVVCLVCLAKKTSTAKSAGMVNLIGWKG